MAELLEQDINNPEAKYTNLKKKHPTTRDQDWTSAWTELTGSPDALLLPPVGISAVHLRQGSSLAQGDSCPLAGASAPTEAGRYAVYRRSTLEIEEAVPTVEGVEGGGPASKALTVRITTPLA
jgi:hypothetical protein